MADLEFRIGAKVADLRAALAEGLEAVRTWGRTVEGEMQRTAQPRDSRGRFLPRTTQAELEGARAGLQRVGGQAESARASVGRLVAQFVTFAAVVKTIQVADEFDGLNARLRLVTNSAEEYNRAQVALFELAQASRAPLGETVRLYTQIANATKDAGVGQETLLQVTETINQAVQLSGVGAQAANAALVQLGQGLASGTLRGEELNSILEQTPALADAIAKGMGITRGELRKYGEEGKITAQQVLGALQNQREEVARAFAQLPTTVGQAVTQVQNAATQIIGLLNETSGATASLASIISDFAAFLSSPAVIGAIVEMASVWSQAVDLMAKDALETVRIMGEATENIIGDGRDMNAVLGDAFRQLPINVRTLIRAVTVDIAAMFQKVSNYGTFLRENARSFFDGAGRDAAFARLQAKNKAASDLAVDMIEEALQERDRTLAAGRTARDEILARRASGSIVTNRTGQGNFKPGENKAAATAAAAAAKRAEQLRQAQLDAEEKLLDDAAKRELAILERKFDDSLIAAGDYYARSEAIELAAIDRSIAIERQRATAGGVDQVKALAEIEILERRRGDIERKGAEDRAAFRRNVDQQLERARIAELEATGNPVEAARLKAESAYRDLLARLRAEGDAAGVSLIERLIGSEVADAGLRSLQERVGAVLADLRGQESLIAAQADAGLLPQLESERQLQVLREASLVQLRKYRDELNAVAVAQRANGGLADPRVLQQITQLDVEIARVTASQRRLRLQVESAGADALGGFFNDLATGARNFGDAVRNAALSFVQSLARMASEALAKRAILALSGGIGGGAGGGLGGLVSALFAHSGALVGGGGGVMRMVNPLVFAGAPRYHGGGMVGLKADERPAILQTGERVLSRAEVAASGQGAGQSVRIINSIDPGLVADYMASAAGERVIVNTITRNRGQVKQLLG
jgi:tape measure domain-containing protein